MPPTEADPVLTLLERQLKQSSAERQAQTEAFTRALSHLRWELRLLMVLFAVLALARDGVFTRIGIPGITIETHGVATMPAPAETSVSTTMVAP